MPTFELYLPGTYSTRRVRRQHIHLVAAAWMLLATWIERVRQRRALASLDDHMLCDIGITRIDAAREYEKPFWR
jgi:uncharacterized protein YjiS (DUF1127 family)